MTNDDLLILFCFFFAACLCPLFINNGQKPEKYQNKPSKEPKKKTNFIQVVCRVTELISVHDGDTFRVKVDNAILMGFFPEGFSVRPEGINTAEVGGKRETGFFAKRRQQREFKKGLKILKEACVYAQRIDWLVSCDDSQESFHKRLKIELDKLENE